MCAFSKMVFTLLIQFQLLFVVTSKLWSNDILVNRHAALDCRLRHFTSSKKNASNATVASEIESFEKPNKIWTRNQRPNRPIGGVKLGRSVPVVCGMVSHLLPKYFHEQKYTFGFLWPPSKESPDNKVLNFCLLPSTKKKWRKAI